jgi:hypothetical protein
MDSHPRKLRTQIVLVAALCGCVLGGCATADQPTAGVVPPRPSADSGEQGDYPAWSRVTSMLLMPFTKGVSADMPF